MNDFQNSFKYKFTYTNTETNKTKSLVISNMKKAVNDCTVVVIKSIRDFLVNSIQGFVKLWSSDIRQKWLIDSNDHELAHMSYQYINSPIGDWRHCAAFLSGQQCFVRQVSNNNKECAEFNVIDVNFVYEMIQNNGEKCWIRIKSIQPTEDSEPIYNITYNKIYNLSILKTKHFVTNSSYSNVVQKLIDYGATYDLNMYYIDSTDESVSAEKMLITKLRFFDSMYFVILQMKNLLFIVLNGVFRNNSFV